MQQKLSNFTNQLISQLHEPTTFWSVGFWRSKRAILQELGETVEPLAIPAMLGSLLDKNASVRAAAADGIRRLLRALRPEEFRWLEEQSRSRSQYGPWGQLTPGQLRIFGDLGEFSSSAFGMATFHRSGYVREAATLGLSEVSDGSELPFLLLRLNDWVPEVQRTAAELLRKRLRPNYAEAFVLNLLLVESLRNAGRISDKLLIEEIEQLLVSQAGQYALMAAMQSKSAHLQRVSFKLALKSGSAEIVSSALRHRDPIIRASGVDALASMSDADQSFQLLRGARNDRSVQVRVRALEAMVLRFPDQSRAWMEAALFDSNAKARALAQFYFRDRLDLRSLYLQALNSGGSKLLYGTLTGVGEFGRREDCAQVLPYTTHGLSRVRRAAIRSVARLAPEKSLELFLNALADTSSSVSREAAIALIKIHPMVSGEMVRKIAGHSRLPHVRYNGLRVISRLRKWESIGYLIEAQNSSDEMLREKSTLYLRRWLVDFNKTFMQPTLQQATRIREVLRSNQISDQLDSLFRSVEGLG